MSEVSAFLIGRNASSHMSNVTLTKSNCATLNYFTKGKKHDPVKHLGLRLSDWTKRLKPSTTKGKKHDQVKHSGLGICDWTKRFKSHELYGLVQ